MTAMLAIEVNIVVIASNVGFYHFCPEICLSGHDKFEDIERHQLNPESRRVSKIVVPKGKPMPSLSSPSDCHPA